MNLKMCLLPEVHKKEKELPHAPRMGKFPFKFHLCITNYLLACLLACLLANILSDICKFSSIFINKNHTKLRIFY